MRSCSRPLLAWEFITTGNGLRLAFTLVAERQSGIPLYFRVLAGSLADVATLHNTAEELRAWGLTECSFTLDRGFYSQANVRELLETGLHFILSVPFTSP